MDIEAAEAVLRAVLDKVCGAGRASPGPDDLPKSASTNAKASNGMEAFLIRQMLMPSPGNTTARDSACFPRPIETRRGNDGSSCTTSRSSSASRPLRRIEPCRSRSRPVSHGRSSPS
jgi:hypothetical protein